MLLREIEKSVKGRAKEEEGKEKGEEAKHGLADYDNKVKKI